MVCDVERALDPLHKLRHGQRQAGPSRPGEGMIDSSIAVLLKRTLFQLPAGRMNNCGKSWCDCLSGPPDGISGWQRWWCDEEYVSSRSKR